MKNLVPIVRKNGITIYGRVIGSNGRLGQFILYNSHTGEQIDYALFSEAEKHMNSAIYLMTQGRN